MILGTSAILFFFVIIALFFRQKSELCGIKIIMFLKRKNIYNDGQKI